jgi:hypothetical protein
MLVLKGCIKKSKVFTGGSHSFLQPHTVESAKKTHDGVTNFIQYDDALHSLNFHGRRKEKKEGVRLKL